MSITAANLTDGIRVDQATQQGSVYDVIHLVCNKPGNYASQVLARVEKAHPELTTKWCKLRINGKGRETPVASATTLVEIACYVLARQLCTSGARGQRQCAACLVGT